MLARAGIGQVLVRRDIDLFTSGAPAPARVDLAIARSPGLERVRGFGSSGFGEQTLIDVYRVDLPVERAAAFARSDVTTLAGGPDDILTALEAGDLRRRAAHGDLGRGRAGRRRRRTSSATATASGSARSAGSTTR